MPANAVAHPLANKNGPAELKGKKLRALIKRQLGAVYTPPEIASWAANLLLQFLGSPQKTNIADPAVGDGALLRSIQEVAHPYSLIGVDIDNQAIAQAKRKLGKHVTLIKSDALLPKSNGSIVEAWKKLLNGKKLNGIIANPPWGALLPYPTKILYSRGYSLARGQFDSFELFIELAINVLETDGIAVFIIPDSIFQPEHKPLRELLLKKTSLLFIARLGEGFFDEVCRGTSILVFKKQKPNPQHKVTCMRLNKLWRDRIFQGKATLAQAEKALSHKIPQHRFLKNHEKRFDIDLSQDEHARVSLIERHINGWASWLDSTRGVELSKEGAVVFCPKCDIARPTPRNVEKWRCLSCNAISKMKESKHDIIVVPVNSKGKGWKPLIVGEDVGRYNVAPSRCIKANVHGINYKNEGIFEGTKLVIRKTGLGIKAAIDVSGAYTNQVVFIFKLNQEKRPPDFLLEYYQGVLCSRIMLAYYLKKNGDNEWRSHPYLTQKIISELPVPDLHGGEWKSRQAKAIASAVKQYTKSMSKTHDYKIEQLVAGMFGLTAGDYEWVMNVLNEAQGLEPIRTLRFSDISSMEPIRV